MSYIGRSPQLGVRTRFYYTATGGETSLSGADDNGNTLVFSDGTYVDVLLNGITLVAGVDYNTSTANTISGLAALTASDVAEIVVYDVFAVGDAVSKSNGGTFDGVVNFGAGANGEIGGTTPAAGTFTTLEATSLDSTPIGGTTPAAGAFTTLEATSLDSTPIGGTTPAAGSFTDMAFNSGYGSVATAYGCRAWVNFNGQGTVAIRESGNVSSITDNGTGDYTVNFATAMPDAEYSKCIATSPAYGTAVTTIMTDVQSGGLTEVAPTSSSFRFVVSYAGSATRADPKYASVIVVR